MVPPGESPNRAGRRRRNRSEPAPAPGRGQRAQGRAGTQPAQRWRLRLRAARRLGLVAVGMGASLGLLGLVWPQGDPADQAQEGSSQGLNAELPSRPGLQAVCANAGQALSEVSVETVMAALGFG